MQISKFVPLLDIFSNNTANFVMIHITHKDDHFVKKCIKN